MKRLAMIPSLICFLVGSQGNADDDLISILEGTGGAQQSADAPKQVPKDSPFHKAILAERGVLSAEQNILVSFVDQNKFDKALYQWSAAFDRDPASKSFSISPTGRALKAYLLRRAGMPIIALESLLSISEPTRISAPALHIWKEAISDTDPSWNYISPDVWKSAWTEVFGVATEIKVLGRSIYSAEQVEKVKELIKKAPVNTTERAWLEWQLVVGLSLTKDSSTAGKALAHLMTVPNNPVSKDLMVITAARLLFQNGYLDPSIKYYEQVSKSSDYWIDAQEEMAWSYIRKGEPQNSLAITKTLTHPSMAAMVGPEVHFLHALGQLKVCDYPKVIESLNSFRERFKPRTQLMISLATEKAETDQVKSFIQKAKLGKMKLVDLGREAAVLPRHITRDEQLFALIATERELEKEAKMAGDLYGRSLSDGTAQVGFQASLEEIKNAVDTRVRNARSATLGRIKSLAKDEVDETQQMLQKLHVVEAEVIQQIGMADRVVAATSKVSADVKKVGTTGSKARDTLWFPAEEKETWFDELANYRVDVSKGCKSVKK